MSPRVYERLCRRVSVFRRMSGMTVTEFNILYTRIAPVFGDEEKKRLSQRERQRAIGAGGEFKNDVRNRLLMALMWLRLYPTYDMLGFLFDLDKSNVSRNLQPMLVVLREALGDEIKWPDESQREKLKLEQFLQEFPEVIAIVDATEQPTQRPKDKDTQKKHYSGKKKRHTLKNQVVIMPQGEIIQISKTTPGAQHDKKLFDESGISDQLAEEEAFMGDKGYQGIQQDHLAILPDKKPKGKELTEEQKARNKQINTARIVVEHTIGRLKSFQVLAQTYRHPRESHDTAFEIVAALANRQIRSLSTRPAYA